MCGINGVFACKDSAPPVDESDLVRVRDAMVKRGPDGAGLWISSDRRVGLGHRRLSIIDLSENGAQPMATADGRLHVTFNGEIYNYKALRRELEQKGFAFRTQSDTEVLLHLYADRGTEMVNALRGMFAFGIWDEREKSLFLARDPFGIKPLYIADDGTTIRFASQVKALALSTSVDLADDPAGYVSFCLWGSVAEPYTLHKGIRSLGAGESLLVRQGGSREARRHFSLRDEILRAEESPSAAAGLAEALNDSVAHHLVADVPVAVFQSAGLDSSTITALAAAQLDRPLKTVTLGFEEYRETTEDEVPLAGEVAHAYGTEHHVARVAREHFENELENLLQAMDQPSIDGVNTYFVAKAAAAQKVKVALSGLGGDELFAGYPSFRQVPAAARWLRWAAAMPSFGRTFRALTAPLLGTLGSPKYAGVLEYGGTLGGAYLLRRGLYMPWELERFFSRAFMREGLETLDAVGGADALVKGVHSDRLRITLLESSLYMRNQLLRDADWAGMAHSVEIRVPFVDAELYRKLLPSLAAPGAPDKLRLAAMPAKPLPPAVLGRAKTGFSIPVREWMTASQPGKRAERRLRGWARRACPRLRERHRVLALVTDAYGGRGGIAKFNRDLFGALAAAPFISEVVAIPRIATGAAEAIPSGVTWVKSALGGKEAFIGAVAKSVLFGAKADLVICGHINLLPVAWLAAVAARTPLVLNIHGIEAWQPTKRPLVDLLVRRIDSFIAVSKLTADRFKGWARAKHATAFVLHNSIDLDQFHPAPRRPEILERYRLQGAKTLLTLGRMDPNERYKGFDQVLEILPELIREYPSLRYVLAGDGADSERLRAKARALKVGDNVIFTGFVREAEKAALYNVADVFVMPSTGEGFGIVFLEAMACGVPAIGSTKDGGREALGEGVLGQLVDPDSPEQLTMAIRRALGEKKVVPEGINRFSSAVYADNARRIFQQVLLPPERSAVR